MKRNIQILIFAMLVTLLQACGGDDPGSMEKAVAKIDTNTPDGTIMAAIQSLKNNDIKSLMQASMSEAEYSKAVAEFENAKKSPSEADKAKFAQMMGMLTADGAEDQLMAMATPQLEQMRTQLPMLLMMGKGMISQSIESNADIPADQKETVTKVANAAMDFLSNNDILSEEVTRKALGAAIKTAKDLNMKSLDELQNMTYDQAMAKAGIVMGGVKNVMNAYGISVDDMLDSIDVSEVVTNGDTASMKLAYNFLGESFKQDVKMIKKDGKWTADKK